MNNLKELKEEKIQEIDKIDDNNIENILKVIFEERFEELRNVFENNPSLKSMIHILTTSTASTIPFIESSDLNDTDNSISNDNITHTNLENINQENENNNNIYDLKRVDLEGENKILNQLNSQIQQQQQQCDFDEQKESEKKIVTETKKEIEIEESKDLTSSVIEILENIQNTEMNNNKNNNNDSNDNIIINNNDDIIRHDNSNYIYTLENLAVLWSIFIENLYTLVNYKLLPVYNPSSSSSSKLIQQPEPHWVSKFLILFFINYFYKFLTFIF